jgi:hypothetical protein
MSFISARLPPNTLLHWGCACQRLSPECELMVRAEGRGGRPWHAADEVGVRRRDDRLESRRLLSSGHDS